MREEHVIRIESIYFWALRQLAFDKILISKKTQQNQYQCTHKGSNGWSNGSFFNFVILMYSPLFDADGNQVFSHWVLGFSEKEELM